jgi:hypothetical protein
MTDGRKDAKTASAVLSSCQLGIPAIVTTFPRTVRVIGHTLIPLKDGTTLAARKI